MTPKSHLIHAVRPHSRVAAILLALFVAVLLWLPGARPVAADTAPDTTILSHPPLETNSNSADFVFNSNQDNSTFQCQLNGGEWEVCTYQFSQTYTSLADGLYTFRVRAVSPSGVSDPTPASWTWTIDQTAPETTITDGPSGLTNNNDPSFTFTSNEPLAVFKCRLDSGFFTSCASPKSYTDLADGSHTVTVQATDPAGNTDLTPDTRSFTIDATVPVTTITGHPSILTNDNDPSFAFSVSEPGTAVECKLDTGGWETCASPKSYTDVANGAHTFTVRATDAAGNTTATPAAYTWTIDTSAVDTTPPETTIASGPPSPAASRDATFTFSGSDPGGFGVTSFACRLDAGEWAACASPKSYTNLADGAHTFSVRATDAANNTDPTAATHTWTINDWVSLTLVKETEPAGESGFPLEAILFYDAWTLPDFEAVVAVDAAGNVYSGDSLRVRKYDAAGNLLATFGSDGIKGGQFSGSSGPIKGLAVDSASNIYVGDRGNLRIQKFDANGAFVWAAGYDVVAGNAETGFEVCTVADTCKRGSNEWYLEDIDIDSAGNIFVAAPYQGQIIKLNGDGAYLAAWGSTGYAGDQFSGQLYGIAVDSAGYVYTADQSSNRLQKFTNNGTFVWAMGWDVVKNNAETGFELCTVAANCKAGVAGSGEGQFNEANDVDVDIAGNLYVAESGNERIQKLAPDGRFLAQWGSAGSGPGQFFALNSVAVGAGGRVHATDRSRLQRFDMRAPVLDDGESVTYLVGGGPQQITESLPDHWRLADITCTGATATRSGTRIDLTPAPGASVTCTFTNHKLVNLTVVKETVPAGGEGFTFALDPGSVHFAGRFGSLGTGDGQFIEPTGVAVDAAGNVYVSDSTNHRIQKFSAAGDFLRKWQSGSGKALRNPVGLAVDAAGNLFVADRQAHGIIKYAADGNFAALWGWDVIAGNAETGFEICTVETSCQAGDSGSGQGQFNSPVGVAVDRGGNVYVTEMNNHRLQEFDNNGAFIRKWGTSGSGPGQFDVPYGVAVDRAGNVYVADRNNSRIQKFGSDGAYLHEWGSQGSGDGQFDHPFGVAVDGAGNVYVADWANQRVQKFDSDGVFLNKWGSDGPGDGQFESLKAVAVDGVGTVYTGNSISSLIDSAGLIQKFTLEGGVMADGGRYTYSDRVAGDFRLTELMPDGWTLRNVTCAGATGATQVGAAAVTVTLTPGQDATCTVRNTYGQDTTPPETTIDSKPTNVTNNNDASFTFSGDDGDGFGVASFECKLDAADYAACTSPQSYTNLSDGSHTFQVRATDAADNVDPTPAGFEWIIDTTRPSVTINQAAGQADPTNAGPIHFTVVFSEAVSGFTGSDVTLNSTAGTVTATVTETAPNNGTTYDVAVSGMNADGSVVAIVGPSVAHDAAGNGNTFSTWTDNSVSYNAPDTTRPSVTINQAAGQADPTSAGPIHFTVVFSEPVTGFAANDVTLTSTAGAVTATVTETAPNNGTTYDVAVSGMNADGSVVAIVGPGRTQDATGNGNTASTSTDNSVNYDQADTTRPSVTINQAAGQADPTNAGPIHFTVVFSEAVSGFTGSDVTLNSTAGTVTATVTETAPNNGTTYDVAVSGMTADGSVVAIIAPSVAQDAYGNFNTFSTWTDNSVSYNAPDTTPPAVTINQAAGQSDPTGSSPINFTAVFNEPVTGFACSDVTVGGTAGATTATVTQIAPNNGTTYNVAVNGMTGSGTVVATIAANVAQDAAINGNAASTSTDNSVTYNALDTTPPDTTLAGTPPNPWNSSSASFTFSSEAEATFECNLDNGGFDTCTSPKDYTGLSDGSHTFAVYACDATGNCDQTPAGFDWVIDATPPDTTLTGTPPNPSNSSSAEFTFSSEAEATFECNLDNGGFDPCTSPKAFTGLADRDHIFTVRATDGAGNNAEATYTWTIDTVAPDTILLTGPTGTTSGNDPVFTFSSEANSTFFCALDGGTPAACNSGSQAYTDVTDGAHTFAVYACDPAGNCDPSPATRTWTIDTGSWGDDATIYVTASGGSVPGVGKYQKNDILRWDGAAWSVWFDGAGKMPASADIIAFDVANEAAGTAWMSFRPPNLRLPGLVRVQPQDIVYWNGSAFSLFFDGTDVALTRSGERINGLEVLPGSVSPVGTNCLHYLLISTSAGGVVPIGGNPAFRFTGEDVLGFCMTSSGPTTAGVWHLAFEGQSQGLPKNNTVSLAASSDATTLYFIVPKACTAGGVAMQPSRVYSFSGGVFHGPLWTAADHGLRQMVDGIDIKAP